MAASDSSPVARVHALWTLEGLGSSIRIYREGAQDASPGVRENAIRLAEAGWRKTPSLCNRLLSMDKEPDARVRFQLLCTLGFVSTPAAQKVRDRLACGGLRRPLDADGRAERFAGRSARLLPVGSAGRARTFIRQAAAVIGVRRNPAELQRVLASVSTVPRGEWRSAALEGLATGLRGKGGSVPDDIRRQPAAAL